MKKNEAYENMTMDEIMAELEVKVSDYNLATTAEEKVDLTVECNALVEKYNELSLLHTYAECLKAELPIVALAKAYYYPIVKTKDAPHTEVVNGKSKTTLTRSIQEGVKKMNLVKFLEWTEEGNKCAAASKTWRVPVSKARSVVTEQWVKFFASGKDSHSMSIGKTKKALQEMFDALVFIPTESGKNAVIATNSTAKYVLAFANKRNDSLVDGNVKITGTILSQQTWATLLMDILHNTVENKEYEIIVGDDEDDTKTEDTKAEAKKSDDKKKPEPKAEDKTESK